MRVVLTIVLVGLFAAPGFTQQRDTRIDELKKIYESFRYRDVISGAESLLQNSAAFSSAELIEIFRLKAFSHYSLMEESKSEQSFAEIIRLDKNYELDPVRTSPKILGFFKEVKSRAASSSPQTVPLVIRDTVKVKEQVFIEVPKYDTVYIKNSDYPFLPLPGLPQYRRGEQGKGIALMCAAGASLVSSVFFLFDARAKEIDYLNAVTSNTIQERYNSFNTAYKLRNISFAAFAAVFLYSQVDVLFYNTPTASARMSFYKPESGVAGVQFLLRF